MSKPAQFEVWGASGDDFIRGLDAPRDADPDAVLKAFLWELEGLDPSELTEAERLEVLGCIVCAPMWSVVKADREVLGDDCGEFHTEGSGKRRRDAWWLENRAQDVVERIVERLQSECAHAAPHASGLWCTGCGLPMRRVGRQEEAQG